MSLAERDLIMSAVVSNMSVGRLKVSVAGRSGLVGAVLGCSAPAFGVWAGVVAAAGARRSVRDRHLVVDQPKRVRSVVFQALKSRSRVGL